MTVRDDHNIQKAMQGRVALELLMQGVEEIIEDPDCDGTTATFLGIGAQIAFTLQELLEILVEERFGKIPPVDDLLSDILGDDDDDTSGEVH